MTFQSPVINRRRAACQTDIGPRPLRRGAAALELALVLPVLLLIIFGCVDFGRVVYVAIALNSATGAGTAYAATHRFTRPSWETQIRETVLQELQTIPDFEAHNLTVTVETIVNQDDSVQVAVQASYPFHTVVNWPALPSTVMLEQRIEARQFR
jgi:Flp pilus assembly protein TadG